MTTESVLEKLKELKSELEYVAQVWETHKEREEAGMLKTESEYFQSIKFAHGMSNLLSRKLRTIDDYLPRLIAALELVGAKAKEKRSINPGGTWVVYDNAFDDGYNDGEIEFAREVLAVVNGETKGE